MHQFPCVIHRYLPLYVPPGAARIEFEVDGWRFVAERSSFLIQSAVEDGDGNFVQSDYWHIGGRDDPTAKLHITALVPDESIAESWFTGPEFAGLIRERLAFVLAMMQVKHRSVRDHIRWSLSSILSWRDFQRQKKAGRAMVAYDWAWRHSTEARHRMHRWP